MYLNTTFFPSIQSLTIGIMEKISMNSGTSVNRAFFRGKFEIDELLYAFFHFPMAFTSPFISWYFFFGLSERDFIASGLIIAIPYFFLIFSTGIFGRLSDKIGSKNLVLISLGALSLSFLFYFMIQEKLLFFLTYIGFNIIVSAFVPSLNRLISFHTEDREKKFGKLGMMASVGFLLGSVFASIVFELNISGNSLETFRTMFPIAMIIAFLTFLFAFRLKEAPSSVNDPSIYNALSNSKSPFSPETSSSLRPVFVLFVLIALINMSSSTYVNFFSIFVQDELKHNISFIAIANSIATLLGAFATYFVGRGVNKLKRKYLVLLASILYTVFPLCIFVFRDPIVIFILYCLPFYAILFVLAPIYISENSLESRRGQVMGLYVGSQYFGLTVGTILGALIASTNGLVSPNFLVGSLIGFIAIIICFFYFKETSDQTLTN